MTRCVGRWTVVVLVLLTMLRPGSAAVDAHAAAARKTAISKLFTVTKAIEPAYRLWLDTYTTHDRNHVMLHDTQHMQVVYDVVDLSDIAPLGDPFAPFPPDIRDARRARVDAGMERVRTALQRLAENPQRPDATPFEKKIVALFAQVPGGPGKYGEAAASDRLRSQTGLSDRFRAGIIASGRYMPQIERVFREEHIPWEISRLPFVESMFDLNAYSKVGASGLWQFMPGTAKLVGLTCNGLIDERNDPISATRGAAKLLRNNFSALNSWPLAINAYNSGPGRLRNAVASLGTTDISTIVRNYHGPGYGFASRNFYPEFLAALHAYEQRDRFFGPLTVSPALQYDTVITTRPVSLPGLASATHTDMAQLSQYNPGFTAGVYQGSLTLPAGYPLKVPKTTEHLFVAAMRKLGAAEERAE